MTDRNDDLLNDPAFLRGLTMRRMTRRDLFRSAGVGARAVVVAAAATRAAAAEMAASTGTLSRTAR